MAKRVIKKTAKSGAKAVKVSTESSKVLSRGQKKRSDKRDAYAWKKTALEAAVRDQKIAVVGKALGTMDDLSRAMELPELDDLIQFKEKAVKRNVTQKSGAAMKHGARQAMREQELKRFDEVIKFQPFLENPAGAVQAHIRNQAAQQARK